MTGYGFDFTGAVKEYADMAFSVAYRLLGSRQDAEDAVQQAFVKVYKNRKEYRKDKNLKNWIKKLTLPCR